MYKRFTALALCLCLLGCLLPLSVSAEEITVEVDKEAVLSGLFEADIATIREAILAGVISSQELT